MVVVRFTRRQTAKLGKLCFHLYKPINSIENLIFTLNFNYSAIQR